MAHTFYLLLITLLRIKNSKHTHFKDPNTQSGLLTFPNLHNKIMTEMGLESRFSDIEVIFFHEIKSWLLENTWHNHFCNLEKELRNFTSIYPKPIFFLIIYPFKLVSPKRNLTDVKKKFVKMEYDSPND